MSHRKFALKCAIIKDKAIILIAGLNTVIFFMIQNEESET